MYVIGQYSINYVLDLVKSNKSSIDLHGFKNINISSVRLKTFYLKGVNCICCNAQGKYFKLESSLPGIKPHFNLYAVNKNGHEVLMTRDHIILKSRGGTNTVSNMSPMCEKCNQKRGSKFESQEEFLSLFGEHNDNICR